jgi:hypothetical protein
VRPVAWLSSSCGAVGVGLGGVLGCAALQSWVGGRRVAAHGEA